MENVKQKDGRGRMLREGGVRENQEHNVNCGRDGVSTRRRESMEDKAENELGMEGVRDERKKIVCLGRQCCWFLNAWAVIEQLMAVHDALDRDLAAMVDNDNMMMPVILVAAGSY